MSADPSREKLALSRKGPAVPPPLPSERGRTEPREPAVTPPDTPIHRKEASDGPLKANRSAEPTEALHAENSDLVASAGGTFRRPGGNAVECEYLLISRKRIQAYLLLLIATGFLGFLVGRGTAGSGSASSNATSRSASHPPADPVLLTGSVHFAAKGKPLAPDAGAVIIALPFAGARERLPVDGFRPWNANLALRKDATDRIASLGGAFTQADADGGFQLVVPAPGEYHLLIISNKLARPAAVTSRPNRGIDELDLKQLAEYFDRPADLIGPQAYSWIRRAIRPGMAPLGQVFQEGDNLGLDEVGLP
ncbi:MAG: hypothetical protein ACUVQQ_09115 [Thermogutta sp.]